MAIITIFQVLTIIFIVLYLSLNMLHIVKVRLIKSESISYPNLSVCIPARNEERDIQACVESLLNQNYPKLEIIVVDDNSTDETAKIVSSMKEKYPHLIFISGKKLVDGWLGKPYALQQAYTRSCGEYLLFTDADLVYQPYALKSAMNLMLSRDFDLLTLMPAAIFGSFWERAIQPVIFGFIASLTRFKNVNSPACKSAMGFGAFLLFKKESYERIGGHQSVCKEILEDVMLAKHAKLNGLSMLVADGKNIFSIRMYHSLKEIWIGWRKNIFLAMNKSIVRTIYYAFMLLCFFLTPCFVLLGNIWLESGFLWIGVSMLGVLLTLITGLVLCHELNLNKINVFLFPLGAVVMVAIMMNSMFQVLFFGRAEWRGRIYGQ